MIQFSPSWLGVLLSFVVCSAHADWIVPPDSNVLGEIAMGRPDPLPTQIKFLTWNVEKAKTKAAWSADFQNLMKDKNLAILQEAVETNLMNETLRSIENFSWIIARTFFMETDRKGTGVLSGSSQRPLSLTFLRSRDTEPFAHTPKMTLFSTYDLENGEKILVMNIHAINFTTLGPFHRQIDAAAEVLKSWTGKVIAGGDFNTWAALRMTYLLDTMKGLGLEHVSFKKDPRRLVLDHIFVRGCEILDSQIHQNIRSSDHFPLSTELSCQN